MLNSRLKQGNFLVKALACFTLLCLASCSQGDTDGGDSVESANAPGVDFVADGGAGGSITIRVVKEEFSVGERVTFFVDLLDASGAPQPFIRVFCESEKGIAIIEPSSGGVAFESTGPDGSMSGVLGGLLPGSFMLECRAPQGFNLVDRVRLKITGEVPAGFEGFPGAAGGNLGGGVIVDDTPDADDVSGVRITGIRLNDSGGSSSSSVSDVQIDLSQQSDCDGDVTTTDPEPFFFTNFSVTLANGSPVDIFVDSFTVSVAQGPTISSLIQVNSCEVPAGGTATCSGPFSDFDASATGANPSGKALAGSGTAFDRGTFNVTFTADATTEAGDSFDFSNGIAVTFDYVNRCE